MQCYYCILMIKELKMTTKELLWEDIIDWGPLPNFVYDTSKIKLNPHEQLIAVVGEYAVIFALGTEKMRSHHVDIWCVYVRNLITGKVEQALLDEQLFEGLLSLQNNSLVFEQASFIIDSVPWRNTISRVKVPPVEIDENIIKHIRKFSESFPQYKQKHQLFFFQLYGMVLAEENKHILKGEGWCLKKKNGEFWCKGACGQHWKIAGKYIKWAALVKLLKYNESPRDIEICYVDKEVVYILKDVLNFIKDGYITPLPERLEKYYNNNKHKLEGGE